MLALTLIAPWALGQDLTETRRLAEQGDADAQYNLGYRYVTGIGVPQDRAEAVRWLRLAADQGHTQAEDFLGRMPPMGSQRATDNVAETELPATLPPATGQSPRSGNPFRVPSLRTDAEQGDADAQFSLGVRYDIGLGVPQDDAEAVRWYRLAADQGNATAQNNLGLMYANGEGVLKDSVLAHMWFNIAGANGNEAARKRRDNLERDMTRDEITRATELARACMASDYQDCER